VWSQALKTFTEVENMKKKAGDKKKPDEMKTTVDEMIEFADDDEDGKVRRPRPPTTRALARRALRWPGHARPHPCADQLRRVQEDPAVQAAPARLRQP